MSMHRHLIASLLVLFAHGAHAADISPPPAPATDKLAGARAQIAASNWAGAIDELRRVNDTGSADWNNLMGYSLRKQATPDLDGSERYYNNALRIDPNHRAALEYSGELFLMKKDVAGAELRLTKLQSVCGTSCTEYHELKDAIARYKGNGNKSSGY